MNIGENYYGAEEFTVWKVRERLNFSQNGAKDNFVKEIEMLVNV